MKIQYSTFLGVFGTLLGLFSWGSPSAIAQPLAPGNIIVAPSVCVNTTGGSCRSGTIVVDDGTCKRNVVVQPSSIAVTGDRRASARSAQIVEIGGCIPDGGRSTATVIANPQIMVAPTPPRRPDVVNPHDLMPQNMPR